MATTQRIAVLLATLVLAVIPTGGASAALKKFTLAVRTQVSDPDVSPNPDSGVPRIYVENSVALIDAGGGPNPVLRRFVRAVDQTTTVDVPSLSIAIFVSSNFRDGPDVLDQIHGNPVAAFTGTGNTAAGTTIRWGVVTGWTHTGSNWCNSNPAVVCSLAMLMDEATAEPRFNSEFYDLGTWNFHGTGFTAFPFINSYSTNSFGNTALWVRGFRTRDGTVPALPLLGIATLGASLVAGGVAALSRKRNR